MDSLIDLYNQYSSPVLNLLAGLLILILAYIVARILAGVTRKLLNKTDLDNRFAKAVGSDRAWPIENVAASVVFWTIIIFGIIGFFNRIQFSSISEPLSVAINEIFGFLPNLLGALLIALLAWIVASIVKAIVAKGAELLRIDERLNDLDKEGESKITIGGSIADAAYWLILLLFLPAILERLQMNSLVEPLLEMFNKVFAYLPNLFAAGLILLIGYFIARVIRQIVASLLRAVGLDRLGDRVNLSQSLSGFVGTLVYTVILLLVIVQALDALAIEAISQPATMMIAIVFDAIPGVVGATLVLVISYYLGRLIGDLVADLFESGGFNSVPERLGLSWRSERTPSKWVGLLVLIGVILFAVLGASELIGFAPFTGLLSSLLVLAGQVLLGVVVLAIGIYLANLVYRLMIEAGLSSMAATVARIAILVMAAAMGLRQMGLAQDIVNLAFGITLAAVGIAAALAFGLGSREVAGREVEQLIGRMRADAQSETVDVEANDVAS